VIGGTPFEFAAPGTEGAAIARALLGQRRRLISLAEVHELKAQCEDGSAWCLLGFGGVLVVALEPAGDDLELFVKLAIGGEPDTFRRSEPHVRTIARQLGATTIAFEARRDGWGRVLGPEWQRRGSVEFVRSV
jgi:hypothetical protein